MKISELGDWIILFTLPYEDEFIVVHRIVYKEHPRVPDIAHAIHELIHDEEFGVGEENSKRLLVDIMAMEHYTSVMCDDELDEE